ncbi:MAG TPA: hypothetical protein VGP07_14450 [Polyangia bacterium]|jgi:hypothetical protein
MGRTSSKRKYSIGELVVAAYKEAARVTDNREVASVIASRTLAAWLSRSDHPELIEQLRAVRA